METETEYEICERRFQATDLKKKYNDNKINKQTKKKTQMNKLAETCCITRGVDSSEKTLDTTIGNECKFSWDSKARRKTLPTKTSALRKR